MAALYNGAAVLRVAGVIDDSIVDGEGFRLTVFVQGCSMHCEGCHNVSAQDPSGGYDITVEQIMELVRKNSFLDGVTFSGGEPFDQATALIELAKAVKSFSRPLTLWMYSGYVYENLITQPEKNELLAYCDVLIDGPFVSAQRTLDVPFKGSKNQRIIDVKKTQSTNAIELYLE